MEHCFSLSVLQSRIADCSFSGRPSLGIQYKCAWHKMLRLRAASGNNQVVVLEKFRIWLFIFLPFCLICLLWACTISEYFSIVESLQSHMILTMSHWSSGLTCLLPTTRVTGSNPLGGYLCGTGILPLALSRYIGDPDVIDHQQSCAPPTVTRPLCPQCDSPTWSHITFLSRFHACCRSPFWLHNRRSRLLGGSFVESLQSYMILTMSH